MYCNLTKLQFKTIYSEPAEVADFYSKALRQARVYKRVSAYFSFLSLNTFLIRPSLRFWVINATFKVKR